MKIKKFEGKKESEVMQRVRDELGVSAIILSIKRKPFRGLMAFFKKPLWVVTAAYEEKTSAEKLMSERLDADKRAIQNQAKTFLQPNARNAAPRLTAGPENGGVLKDIKLADQQHRINSLENKLNVTEELLAKVLAQLEEAEQIVQSSDGRRYSNNIVQLFYDSLLEQGVTQEIAEELLEIADNIDDSEKVDVPLIVKIVYNTILDVLGEPDVIEMEPKGDGRQESGQLVAFMGPTGVGKTTTIAKLCSVLTLNHYARVGLITADTYRIAAVEQLKIYADILGLDVRVVYGVDDVDGSLDLLLPANDVILIDTAGRSHMHEENMAELQALLDKIPESRKYLVVSINTRYEDLVKIVNAYSSLSDFSLIFTKLDETETLGSILNICYLTGKRVSYVTFGQNVPDDIEVVQPEKIAKSLLGLWKSDTPAHNGSAGKGGL